MRTEEAMRMYERDDVPMPNEGWQKMAWMAAQMLKTAKQMRNTIKNKYSISIKEPFVQEEFWK